MSAESSQHARDLPLGSKVGAQTRAAGPRGFEDVAQHARDLCPLALERIGQILRDPMSPDTAVIRAAELVLERGYGKAPAFYTNRTPEFRDPMQMTDAEINERLAAIRAVLIEHGIDPLAPPDRS